MCSLTSSTSLATDVDPVKEDGAPDSEVAA
jgi:hypothetical protein